MPTTCALTWTLGVSGPQLGGQHVSLPGSQVGCVITVEQFCGLCFSVLLLSSHSCETLSMAAQVRFHLYVCYQPSTLQGSWKFLEFLDWLSPFVSGGTCVDLGQPGFPTMHLFSANSGGKYVLHSVDFRSSQACACVLSMMTALTALACIRVFLGCLGGFQHAFVFWMESIL